MKVTIPFLDSFEDLMQNGQKCMTTRRKKYGEVGDTFDAFGVTFAIVAVFEIRLWRVAHDFCRAEGFFNPEGFISTWNKIHYRKGYAKQKKEFFWGHIFFPIWELPQKEIQVFPGIQAVIREGKKK